MVEIKDFLSNIFNLIDAIELQVGKQNISLLGIIQIIGLSILIFLITFRINYWLKKRLLKKVILDRGNRHVVANIVSYSLGTLSFLLILEAIGLNLSILTVLGGAIGIGIGFGLQDLTRNFISGFTLLVERKIKLGDFVKFNNLEGSITEISTRVTTIKLKNGSSVIVPNSQLVEQEIINCHYETDTVRLTAFISVAYGSDLVLVTESLLMAAYTESNILKDPPAQVIFKGFGDSSLNFELWLWIKSDNMRFQWEILSSLYFTIEYIFRQKNIQIPFPQTDLWIKNPEAINGYSTQSQTEILTDNIIYPVSLASVNSSQTSEVNNKNVSIRDALKKVIYFQDLNELEIRKMIEIGQLKFLKAKEVLFYENEPGDAFYIVLSGQVEVFTEKLRKTLALLKAGSFFGELSLMLGIPRTATVRATEETLLFSLNSQNFQKLLQENPDFSEAIIQELSKHKEELNQRKQELQEKGLISASEADANIVIWVRKRLQSLFNF